MDAVQRADRVRRFSAAIRERRGGRPRPCYCAEYGRRHLRVRRHGSVAPLRAEAARTRRSARCPSTAEVAAERPSYLHPHNTRRGGEAHQPCVHAERGVRMPLCKAKEAVSPWSLATSSIQSPLRTRRAGMLPSCSTNTSTILSSTSSVSTSLRANLAVTTSSCISCTAPQCSVRRPSSTLTSLKGQHTVNRT